jgi:hypothetical protein
VSDGGFHDLFHAVANSSDGAAAIAKIKAQAGTFRIGDLPDCEASDLDALVLRRDLIGDEGNRVGRGRTR